MTSKLLGEADPHADELISPDVMMGSRYKATGNLVDGRGDMLVYRGQVVEVVDLAKYSVGVFVCSKMPKHSTRKGYYERPSDPSLAPIAINGRAFTKLTKVQ